jgi:hypothetical protein
MSSKTHNNIVFQVYALQCTYEGMYQIIKPYSLIGLKSTFFWFRGSCRDHCAVMEGLNDWQRLNWYLETKVEKQR